MFKDAQRSNNMAGKDDIRNWLDHWSNDLISQLKSFHDHIKQFPGTNNKHAYQQASKDIETAIKNINNIRSRLAPDSATAKKAQIPQDVKPEETAPKSDQNKTME
jgi:hypothetical protein